MIGRGEDDPVLVVEDDLPLLTAFRAGLGAAGLATIPARSVRVALEALSFHRPAVALIDLSLEGGRGWELLYEAVKRRGTAVIVIDRGPERMARVAALTAGADDVVGPPFDPTELAARVRALGRRRAPDRSQVLRYRDLVLDIASHEVTVAGRPVELTAQQFALLQALCEAGGATLHRKQLLARIASIEGEPPSDRAIDLHMSRLRRRLGALGRDHVESVYGLGYRLASASTADDAAPADPVLEALEGPVVVADASLRIISANSAARAFLGRGGAGLVGRPCGQVFGCRSCDGVDLTEHACVGRALIAGGGRIAHVRAVTRTADGPQQVIFTHTAVRSPGGDALVAIEVRPAD